MEVSTFSKKLMWDQHFFFSKIQAKSAGKITIQIKRLNEIFIIFLQNMGVPSRTETLFGQHNTNAD